VTVRVLNHGAAAYFPWDDNLQRNKLNTFKIGQPGLLSA
jgi:hypothetical protein